jgi:signal transduction histidine kinase
VASTPGTGTTFTLQLPLEEAEVTDERPGGVP